MMDAREEVGEDGESGGIEVMEDLWEERGDVREEGVGLGLA